MLCGQVTHRACGRCVVQWERWSQNLGGWRLVSFSSPSVSFALRLPDSVVAEVTGCCRRLICIQTLCSKPPPQRVSVYAVMVRQEANLYPHSLHCTGQVLGVSAVILYMANQGSTIESSVLSTSGL